MSREEPYLLEAYGDGPDAVQRVGDISLLVEEESPGSARSLWPSPGSPNECKPSALRTKSEDFEQETAGLTTEEAEKLQKTVGFNEISAAPKSPVLTFLSYFLGVVPIVMILTAILIAAVPGASGDRDFFSLLAIVIELFLIIVIEYITDRNTGNAIGELKKLRQCKRDGEWVTLQTRELVPGDICSLQGGTIIPADGTLVGKGLPILVDESSLTGESLAVTKGRGDEILQGAVVQSGELCLRVEKTGCDTLFGKALELLGKTDSKGNLKRVLEAAARMICGIGAVFCLAMMFVQIFRDDVPWYRAFAFAMALLCSILPSAMPLVTAAVLSNGALELSKEKALVARLSSIEEFAGMDILCTDKTGTLTLNQLVIDREEILEAQGFTKDEVLLYASLASKHENPILKFVPFNPVDKRSEATVRFPDGQVKIIVKGAPQIVLVGGPQDFLSGIRTRMLDEGSSHLVKAFEAKMNQQGARGLRTLGVAVCDAVLGENGEAVAGPLKLMGLISMLDPPRTDTAETVAKAMALGVDVKMLTGDQRAIAVETCRRLNMGTNVLGEEAWSGEADLATKVGGFGKLVESVNGFASVSPEHKFLIVKALQGEKHMVGMTGDGVNDGPALKKADVGIAVAGASDAARAAADIILLEPGLSTIIKALVISRCIFKRLRNYVVFRAATSLLLLLFYWTAAMVKVVSPPLWCLLLLKFLNDLSMMATSRDHVIPSNKPEKWRAVETVCLSGFLGSAGAVACIVFSLLACPTRQDNTLFWSAWNCDPISRSQLNLAVFLLAGIIVQLTMFSARSNSAFFWCDRKKAERPSIVVLLSSLGSMLFMTFFSVYLPDSVDDGTEFGVRGIGWQHAGVVWLWGIIWFLPMDAVKVMVVKFFFSESSSCSFLRFDGRIRHTEAQKELKKRRKEAQMRAYGDGIAGVVQNQQDALHHQRQSFAKGGPVLSVPMSEFRQGDGKLQYSASGSFNCLPAPVYSPFMQPTTATDTQRRLDQALEKINALMQWKEKVQNSGIFGETDSCRNGLSTPPKQGEGQPLLTVADSLA
ncbi:haloacid dehalogenase family hydrolase domain-containing protein [Cystoisospora suis]|uniref:Haloacid dehalogenase family hydrolase domain-containing protein n=1 Tax=Cystoisospora suis TaxID=483139 RepID=A0A2C6LBL8_9APIC|nr:haloacid dehalogenase family hydrolase domain-containing protein [Cystoisospora suis]